MQTVIISIFLLFTTLAMQAQNTIAISISGFENNDGKAMIGLYNKKVIFLKRPYKSISSVISEKQLTVAFKDIPNRTYAVSVFHDEDNDNKFDRFMGLIPTEGYGNSNNVPPRYGPPKWEDAQFEVKGGETKK